MVKKWGMEYRVDKMMDWETADGESRVVGMKTHRVVVSSGRVEAPYSRASIGNSSSSSPTTSSISTCLTSSSPILLIPSYDQEQQDQPTDLSKKKKKQEDDDNVLPPKLRKHKPIPPPLDLSINLSLHHQQNNHPLVTQPSSQHQNQQQSPSPKNNDKNLPLRKR